MGPTATRRSVLGGAALLPVLASGGIAKAAESRAPGRENARVAADLARYIGFGSRQSGSDGDNACGAWLEGELCAAGFATQRQEFSVPWFEAERSELTCAGAGASLWPQPIVIEASGLDGPLVRVGPGSVAAAPLDGAIALIDLPSRRWSSALSPEIRVTTEAVFSTGAKAAVIVTNGPTGKIIALNTDGREPMFAGPTALMAPEDAAPFFAAAASSQQAQLTIRGSGGRRPAFNLVGRLDRGAPEWLVVSTPRSGWFTCAAERGGGIAAWLQIARWAARSLPDLNLAFVCNSGHEYEYLGAEKMIEEQVPGPDVTRFWLHLGANLAARDWHEAVGEMWPLPGTDSQRYLVVSAPLQADAARLFDELPGLERPYTTDDLTAGELTNVVEAGYPLTAGVFGIHRFHHVAEDDERCVIPAQVAATADAFQALVARAVCG